MKNSGINTSWVDARSLIRTDETWREGRVQWNITNDQIRDICLPLLTQQKVIVTQGFIGSTAENNTVTFGKEKDRIIPLPLFPLHSMPDQ
ncbi:MAG: hypothetical protein U0T81_01305 [Saprospiraceae bacterium]